MGKGKKKTLYKGRERERAQPLNTVFRKPR
jgi:hypothetical protein